MRAVLKWLNKASNNALLCVLAAIYITRENLAELYDALSASGVGFVSWLQAPVSISTWAYVIWVLFSAITLGLFSIPVTRWVRRWAAEQLASLQQRLKNWARGLIADDGAQHRATPENQTPTRSVDEKTVRPEPTFVVHHPDIPPVKASELRDAVRQSAAGDVETVGLFPEKPQSGSQEDSDVIAFTQVEFFALRIIYDLPEGASLSLYEIKKRGPFTEATTRDALDRLVKRGLASAFYSQELSNPAYETVRWQITDKGRLALTRKR